MACCGGASSVIIQGGEGLSVTGSGTVADPYVISGSLDVSMRGAETDSAKTSIVGAGTLSDPYILSVDVNMSVNDLTNVNDATPPVIGDVLLFDGSNWTYGAPPTQAPGQVNTAEGIDGDGTIGDPIVVKVSETIQDATSGLYTYIDANGELRAEVRGVAWAGVTGKPAAFPPSSHTHPNADLTGIFKGTSAPGAGLGIDGDIYIQYV